MAQQTVGTTNFTINPDDTPVYFVDGCMIGSNEQTVILSFAQAVFDGQQHNVVSRVAMTMVQAKTFLKDLNDHIEKFER